ncbi:hypothetical protein SDC9_52394 [bioreactor metagenome]|uniref:Uncharacterized protein n=1 Tax=bioreactor metagenome TaxID=1076179 RepID=A0A644WRK9_9ZZZZ
MKDKKIDSVVKIPFGVHCSRFQCSDCVFFNRSDYNNYGECYCTMNRKYVPADDYTCRDFEWRK